MAKPPPTRLHIEPPIDQWQVTPRNGRTKPIIATGHQPSLWHPGILAKYLAADAFAQHAGGSTLNVSVEHNALGPLSVDLPTTHGQRLSVTRVTLDKRLAATMLPPNRLEPIVVDRDFDALGPIEQALNDASHLGTQGAQVAEALGSLMRPYLHQQIQTQATGGLVTPSFVDRLLEDPVGCVRCYNRAALAYPSARIRPLYAGRDVVEAPLWAQGDGDCTPVYIDLGDSRRPCLFTTQHNQHLDLSVPNGIKFLRPRAISLSAIMRSELCDLFIHGTGGGIYDQVTERWWQEWTGQTLAPKVVVSADVYLPFDVSMATPAEQARAQWFAHHLPHNIDRYAEEQNDRDAELAAEKRGLLDRMNDDRDKRRRAKAFKRIHAINAQLCDDHAKLIHDAQQQVADARVGVNNTAIAMRRDWCFALYPESQVNDLVQRVHSRLPACR